jgi:hypothetical protein
MTPRELIDAMRNDKEFRAMIDAHCCDERGAIMPTDRAVLWAEREFPDESDHDKWGAALTKTIIELYARLIRERQARSN